MSTSWGHIEEFVPGPDSSWTQYVERLDFYFEANEIEDAAKKRAILLSSCGKKAYSLIRSLALPQKPSQLSYKEIVEKLQEHYMPATSDIVQRLVFDKRKQMPTETISEYVAELRRISEHCNFENLDERMRDRLVCGIREESIQKRLLSEPGLTFKKGLEIALAVETASRHAVTLQQGVQTSVEVNKVWKGSKPKYKGSSNFGARNGDTRPCIRCGEVHDYPPSECRHINTECRFCKKMGHLERVCLSKARSMNSGAAKEKPKNHHKFKGKSTHRIEKVDSPSPLHAVDASEVMPSYVLNSVSEKLSDEKFTISVKLNGVEHSMEVDSGAACTIMSEDTFHQLWPSNSPTMEVRPVSLRTWTHEQLRILGTIVTEVEFRGSRHSLPIFVIRGSGSSLVGRNWFQPLGIQLLGIKQADVRKELCSTFRSVFKDGLGTYNGPPVTVEVDPTVKPVFLKPRAVPFALRAKLDDELTRLVNSGVLEPVPHSDWATPLVPVLKKDGSLRICGDYRATVNTAIKLDKYPLPTSAELLATLAGGKKFTRLDLAEAYLQLPVDETTSRLLTVNTHKGLFAVRRLQYGIASAPAIFQRVIDTLLSGIPGVGAYLDDILAAGTSDEQLNERQEEVLTRISNAGLRLKKEKCSFNMSEVEFLGFRLDGNGVHPTNDKIVAIHGAPPPRNKEELQAFLGLLNFYSCFLPGKAAILEPLHRLLDKNAVWTWTKTHSVAFEAAKHLLQSDSVLAHYDETAPLLLACDASPYGVGAVLSHTTKDGRETPVAFASRTLTPTERNYAHIDREALSIIFGVKKFHRYVYGRTFTILTDHKPLLGLLHPQRQIPQVMSPRMLRWTLLLSAYSYTLEYRPGINHGNADALSRLPLQTEPCEIPGLADVLVLEGEEGRPMDAERVANLTRRDPVLSRVSRWVFHGWPEEKPTEEEFVPYFHRRGELSVYRNCLLWGSRVVIPKVAGKEVLDTLHADHPGIVQMKSLGRSYVWWPGLDKDIENCVAECEVCQATRNNPPQAPVHSWGRPSNPWSRLHVDFAGPFQGQVFFLLVDAHSKWLEVCPMPSMTSHAVISKLRMLFATHGLPDVIVSDNAAVFTSTEYLDFMQKNGIRATTVAPWHPSSNGQAERYVQTTKQALRKIIQGDWQTRLARFLLAQHTTPNISTGKAPAELLMGRHLKTVLDRLHPDSGGADPFTASTQKGNTPARVFIINDAVYARNYASGPKWTKARVTGITGPLSYVVQTEEGQTWRRHVDQLRKRLANDPTLGLTPCQPTNAEQEDVLDPPPAVPPDLPHPDLEENVPLPVRRSERIRSVPKRLQDFVL